MRPTNVWMEEYLSHALNYLMENDMLEDFLENYDLEPTEEELAYFDVERRNEDEDY